ncbi:MAG: DNA mismatch repair protein MutS [Rhodoferax sp.]|nr:DNA mismatch repair protein MutS [Rhodoferax sp.]
MSSAGPPQAAKAPPGGSEPRAAGSVGATFSSLADLQEVRKALAEQRAREAAQALERQQQERRTQSEQDLFRKAAGAVQPLPDKGRVLLKQERSAPREMQYQRDEQAVLQEAISDEFDVATLLDTDEHLSFRRPGIGPDVTRKLRRGDWTIQRQLDLHGLRRDDARERLGQFIREAHRQGLRCVRVVHGKGLGSPGKTPVLKNRVHAWLVQKQEVLAFVQARPADGGAGALVVLLMASRG